VNTTVTNSQTVNVAMVAERSLQLGNFSRTPSTRLYLNGALDAVSGNTEIQFCGYAPIDVTGSFSGNIGRVLKWAPNTVQLSGTNMHTGVTEIRHGAVLVSSSEALGSTSSGTTVTNGATLAFAAGVLVSSPEPISIRGNGDPDWQGALDVDGPGEAVFAGPIQLEADTLMAAGSAGSSLVLSGPMSGVGGVEKVGSGRLELSGNNSFGGGTTVTEGELVLSGTSLSPITVSGGVLGGSGSISNTVFISSGTHAAGIPSIHGDYVLAAAATLEVEINGTLPGTDHDQIIVLDGDAGTVSLSGILEIHPRPALTVSSTFILIDNDGNDAVGGTFAGLPEGSMFDQQGYTWQISYLGGDGNDVALTLLAADQPALDYAVSIGFLTLAWPDWASAYSLHSATNLTPPTSWTLVTNAPTLTNGLLEVVLPLNSNGSRFYLLSWP
jgi:autotransporter-associated beta strand protein